MYAVYYIMSVLPLKKTNAPISAYMHAEYDYMTCKQRPIRLRNTILLLFKLPWYNYFLLHINATQNLSSGTFSSHFSQQIIQFLILVTIAHVLHTPK